MKPRPKSKISQWNAKQVLQAIPKISLILSSPQKTRIKFRSLSQPISITPSSLPVQSRLSPKPVSSPQSFIPIHSNFNKSFDTQVFSIQLLATKHNISDQDTQIDSSQFQKRVKTSNIREKYQIPVIKLEKNFPGTVKTEQNKEKSQKIGKFLTNLKGNKGKTVNRRQKKNMKDEAVGNEHLLSQSSGILSQASLVNKYLSVFQPDLNNY